MDVVIDSAMASSSTSSSNEIIDLFAFSLLLFAALVYGLFKSDDATRCIQTLKIHKRLREERRTRRMQKVIARFHFPHTQRERERPETSSLCHAAAADTFG